ncbi:MAG: Hsp20/alpha crystallin family protein [candidate division Zixibacteria bacterium]|nr:Hsp20/alpha crystallin family protein [candidate division Zixibacteria bacterium]
MEINYGIFEGNIYLPESIDPQNVKAEYRDGFLVVRLDKKALILCLEKGRRSETKEIKIEIE